MLQTPKKWRSILCINQDHQQLNMQGLVLNSLANLDVHYCNSKKKAASVMNHIQPDAILFELEQGDDFLSALACLDDAETNNIPIICIVDHAQHQQLSENYHRNLVGAILKPVELLQLPERVIEILENSHLQAMH